MYEMFTDDNPLRHPDFLLPADGPTRTSAPAPAPRRKEEPRRPRCYQCERPANWLAPDSRCGDCTRYTPEEIQGEFHWMEDEAKGGY